MHISVRCGAEDLTNQVGKETLEEKSIPVKGLHVLELD